MANTQMDNYMDSLEKWDQIEFEWDYYEFIRFDDYGTIICDNLETILVKDFHDDLEFWENHLFNKFKLGEKEDEQQEAWILHSKEWKDV